MIINSLLDLDLYKLTMGYFVFKHYKDVPVAYALTDRKKMRLAEIIAVGELIEELNHVMTLRFTKKEIKYLRGTNEYKSGMFGEDFLEFLSKLQLPEYDLSISNGDFILIFQGKWSEAIYWETLAMSILDELYYKTLLRQMTPFEQRVEYSYATLRLAEKKRIIEQQPGLKVIEFGTRRRHSHDWQWQTIESFMGLSQFAGTSNVKAAMDMDLLPVGTFAHELDMGVSAIFRSRLNRARSQEVLLADEIESIHKAHQFVLDEWWELYGNSLSVALTDTYGSEFFYQNFSYEDALKWKGVRHDSADPFAFGERTIKFYEDLGIDPKSKLIVFSDGLDAKAITALYERFFGRIGTSFGWGTNWTNDFRFNTLSIVVKLISAAGWGTVKLSDSPGKEMGSIEDIRLFQRLSRR